MTAFSRFFCRLAEKVTGRYYEGPEPPPRLRDEVRVFAALHPDASPDEWRTFATQLAQNAYRDGFARGFDWSERFWPGPAEDPEVIAEREAHAFSLPEHYLRQLEAQPSPVRGMSADEAARLQHQLEHAGARLVPLETNVQRQRGAYGTHEPRR